MANGYVFRYENQSGFDGVNKDGERWEIFGSCRRNEPGEKKIMVTTSPDKTDILEGRYVPNRVVGMVIQRGEINRDAARFVPAGICVRMERGQVYSLFKDQAVKLVFDYNNHKNGDPARVVLKHGVGPKEKELFSRMFDNRGDY